MPIVKTLSRLKRKTFPLSWSLNVLGILIFSKPWQRVTCDQFSSVYTFFKKILKYPLCKLGEAINIQLETPAQMSKTTLNTGKNCTTNKSITEFWRQRKNYFYVCDETRTWQMQAKQFRVISATVL